MRSSCPAIPLSRAGSRCRRSARYRSARMSTRTASTSTPMASRPRSPPAPSRSCRFISMVIPRRWTRSTRSPRGMACSSSKMRPRRMARAIARARPDRSDTPPGSAFIRQRTWARWAMAGRSSPMIRASPSAPGNTAITDRQRNTSTTLPARTRGSTNCRRRSCGGGLRRLDEENARRREIAAAYRERLAGIEGLLLPAVERHSEHVHHLFVVRSPQRDALAAGLDARGIATMVHYPRPPHLQPAFSGATLRAPLPITEALAGEVLSLPLWRAMTEYQLDYIAAAVRGVLADALKAG